MVKLALLILIMKLRYQLFCVPMKLLVGLHLEFFFHAPILFLSLKIDNGLKFCLHKVVVKDTKKFIFSFFEMLLLLSSFFLRFGYCYFLYSL